ncbi:MAG TPA: PA0069 family radical SAM protein [Acidobacteriota bacterium]|nr:PA0069 family radical SAM protein [Acidobacteriota bacterium]
MKPIKGRGAVSNPASRFHKQSISPFDDGWGTIEEEPGRPRTEVRIEKVRRIIATNQSPDIPFDQSINPYQGCEHGCIYCYARPSHAYWDLSPGLDFETRIFAKPEAPERLREELRKPGYRCKVMALGSNTDPYQPAEAKLEITRGIIEVLGEFRNPVSIVTKSNMVLRDLDLLVPMARRGLASVYISVTSLDHKLARVMEPRAATPQRRLQTIKALAEAGVPVAVLASPIIPCLNDEDLEGILEAAAEAGAERANYLLVRLPHEVKELFLEWLQNHFPDRASKVLNKLLDLRGGRLNDPRFGSRMRGEGRYAELLKRRFEIASRRLGLNRERSSLDTTLFRVPLKPGDQRPLFD